MNFSVLHFFFEANHAYELHEKFIKITITSKNPILITVLNTDEWPK